MKVCGGVGTIAQRRILFIFTRIGKPRCVVSLLQKKQRKGKTEFDRHSKKRVRRQREGGEREREERMQGKKEGWKEEGGDKTEEWREQEK